jgi:hypothetical protein
MPIPIYAALVSVLSLAAQDSKGLPMLNDRHWGEKTEGLAMSISVPETSFKASDEIVLNIILKNFGLTSASIMVRSPWADFAFTVQNGRGQEIAMNQYGRRRAEASLEGRKIIQDLQAGDARSEDFELSKSFKLELGTYTLFVTRAFQLPGHNSALRVKSNPITFHIVD